MDDLNEQPLFQQEQPPQIDPAYFEKIDAEMKELAERILVPCSSHKPGWPNSTLTGCYKGHSIT
jgi:hypothetical protein